MLAACCLCLGVRLLCRLSHPLSETLLQLFGHHVVGIEPQSLVEVVEGLAIVAGAILLRTHHDKGGVVEATERGEVGAVGGFLGEQPVSRNGSMRMLRFMSAKLGHKTTSSKFAGQTTNYRSTCLRLWTKGFGTND